MSKVYIAAPFADKEKMPELAGIFESAGHEITHKWWEVEVLGERNPDVLRELAAKDAWGVWTANYVVLMNTAKSEGKAVEQGLAISAKIPIVAIGKPGEHSKNIFHWLPEYTWVETVQEALACLR